MDLVMRKIVCLLSLLFAPLAYSEYDALDVYGRFETEGRSHVELRDCGNQTPCGYIMWIDPASLEEGKTPESLRTKGTNEPVLGLLMLKGFARRKSGWRSGELYHPKRDKSYRAHIRRLEDGNLEVRPCVGPFCQTQVWALVNP